MAILVKVIVRHSRYEQFFCMPAFPAVEDSTRSVLAAPNSRRKKKAINEYVIMRTRSYFHYSRPGRFPGLFVFGSLLYFIQIILCVRIALFRRLA